MNNRYAEFVRPGLAAKLNKLKLDYEVLSSSGSTMQVRDAAGNQKEILDLISGYGSCLLGHNHPALVNTFIQTLQANTAGHTQLSSRAQAGLLGEQLNKLALQETGRSFILTLANSGAEAVEAAMKHALLAYENKVSKFLTTGHRTFKLYQSQAAPEKVAAAENLKKQWLANVNQLLQQNPPVFLALEGAFHGKTLGALSLTHNPAFRAGFEATLAKCAFLVPANCKLADLLSTYSFLLPFPETENEELVLKEKRWQPFAALFAEPIQGEAGVVPLTETEAVNLRQLADDLQIPLVWDEIQCGCFRTGRLFASTGLGTPGDYYLLGKALGGGLVKTAALLVEKSLYLPSFGLIHSSTFAEDDVSSVVAGKFLQLAAEAAPAVEAEGKAWVEMLRTVWEGYPEVIKEVRGEGLIYGIEFHDFFTSGYYGFQSVSRGGYFNYLLAAWLFHNYQIRVSAPLSNHHTLRLHPPLGCKQQHREQVRQGLSGLANVLRCLDFYALIRFLLPASCHDLRPQPRAFKPEVLPVPAPAPGIPKAGFITHYIDQETLSQTDPSLTAVPVQEIEALLTELQDMLSPVITGSREIVAQTGETVHLTMVGAPFTAAMAKQALDNKEPGSFRGWWLHRGYGRAG